MEPHCTVRWRNEELSLGCSLSLQSFGNGCCFPGDKKLVVKGEGLRRLAVAVGCCNYALLKSLLPALFLHPFLALQKCVTNFTGKGEKGRKGEGPRYAGLGLCSSACPCILFQL